MNENAGCSCLFLIMIFILKLWALYYIINEVAVLVFNGEEIGIAKLIWAVILLFFILAKPKLTINNKNKNKNKNKI